jgi:hypothetical protein
MPGIEYYTWGTPALAFGFGNYTIARPVLSEHEWHEIDRALEASTARSGWRVTIVLVARNAEDVARGVYVVNEGGPSTLDAVIALGHLDHSLSWCVDQSIARDHDAKLTAFGDTARRALDRGSLVDALRSIAAALE